MPEPADSIPGSFALLMPTLNALKDLGGSGRIDEILERVVANEGFTDEQVAVRRSSGHHMGLLEYRLTWARNYLKNIGAIENSTRGVWTITSRGRAIQDAAEVEKLVREHKAEYNRNYYATRKRRKVALNLDEEEDADDSAVEQELGWKEHLLDRLLAMSPDAFERLAQRLLKEAGFRNVEVLGKSGDGGLDGVGVYRLSLVSFPVFFQCKRWQGSVGPGEVRNFRGAMAGRGEKGLLITTGTFTKEARTEASRDGAPPIELIDGDDLCALLKEYELGVRSIRKTVEEVEIDPHFFTSL